MNEARGIKFIKFNDENKELIYLVNNTEKIIKIKFETENIVEKLNYLLEVLDGKYTLINGVRALIKADMGIMYTSSEIDLLEKIIKENKEVLKEEGLVLYKLQNKRYSKDLVGNIDNDEKLEFLIDVALDNFRYKLRKALSLYKGNEIRVKKYFKMCNDINYSEIDESGETPKANIILTEILYKNLNSNFIEEKMKFNNIDSEDFYVRLYTIITLYCRLGILNKLANIEKIDYEITYKIHGELVDWFNKETVERILKIVTTDNEYVFEK